MQISLLTAPEMWFLMESVQRSYTLSERLLRAIASTPSSMQEREDLEDLIRQGADINQPHGTLLPLQCACMVGDVQSLKILIELGAQVNAFDGYNRTALHHAAEHSAECVQLLIQNGANTEDLDINHNTPLHWAVFRNKWECALVLLEAGANVDAKDFNNDTPLSWAAMKGNLESVKILLEYNASVDTINYNGMTPFSRVAVLLATGLNSNEDDSCFELLLRASGKIDLRDPSGHLPSIIERDKKLSEQLMILCSSPRSLLELSRFAVRKYLHHCHIPTIVRRLPIPERLQPFLLLEC